MKHVTFHLPSFLRRVRIHGGEFDSSARAMNREEQVRLLQADLRIVRGSTIERKQMSTTIKRVALVAVAALGLGVMSVAPSQAAHQADTLTLTPVKSAISAGDTATATVNSTFIGAAAGDSITVSAIVTTKPTSGNGSLEFRIVDSLTATVSTANLSASISTGVTANNTPANTNYTLNFVSPTVAGAYTIQVYATTGSGGGTIRSAVLSWPVTVTAIDNKADATSTSIIARGVSVTGTEDSVTAFTRSLTTAGAAVQAATILVTQKSAITTAVPNESMTVTISGPGSLSSGATTTGSASGARAITVKNTDYIHVFNDGSSGVATITVTGATSGAILGTEKVTFFGAAATLSAKVEKAVVGVAASVADVLLVTVKDSAGVDVTNLTSLGVVSATTAAIKTNYAATATWSDAKGGYLVTVEPVAAGSSALTVTTKASATATTGVDAAAAVSVRVGSATAASVTVALDKAAYAPGEAVKATITVLDKDGLTVADGVYNNIFATTGISANYTISGWSDTTTVTVASGVGTRTGFMPTTEGDVTFKWTTGTNLATANQGVAGTPIVVSVSSPAAAAATDAANEATDAANAATDAALAAAEAADAATTAAQEASDAVAALSASVTKLIAGLQSQIKSLAAVVAKIAKKVRA
jgi:trimeric autotransporter adhesin